MTIGVRGRSFIRGITLWPTISATNPASTLAERAYLSPAQENNRRQSDRVYLTLTYSRLRCSRAQQRFLGGRTDNRYQPARRYHQSGQGPIRWRDHQSPATRWSWQRGNGSSRRPPYGGSDGCVFGVTMLDPTVVNPGELYFLPLPAWTKGCCGPC